jgi:hypothetical protein
VEGVFQRKSRRELKKKNEAEAASHAFSLKLLKSDIYLCLFLSYTFFNFSSSKFVRLACKVKNKKVDK